MSSLTEGANTIHFDAALVDQVADKAYLALGACDGRLAKAVALVRNGDVRLLDVTDPSVPVARADEGKHAGERHVPLSHEDGRWQLLA